MISVDKQVLMFQLLDMGYSWERVAHIVGVSEKTIACWINPEARRIHQEATEAWRRNNPEKYRDYQRRYYRGNERRRP